MTRAETIRHNARQILPMVRGKSRKERWQVYARLMAGLLLPVIEMHRVLVNEHEVFNKNFDGAWNEMRRGARPVGQRFRL